MCNPVCDIFLCHRDCHFVSVLFVIVCVRVCVILCVIVRVCVCICVYLCQCVCVIMCMGVIMCMCVIFGMYGYENEKFRMSLCVCHLCVSFVCVSVNFGNGFIDKIPLKFPYSEKRNV